MTNINLLPISEKKKRFVARSNFQLALFLLIICIFIIFTIIAYYFKDSDLVNETNNLNNKISTITNEISSYEDIQNKALFINDRKKEINELNNKLVDFKSSLETILEMSQQDISLTGFTLEAGTNSTLKISGTTSSREKIINFIDNLNKSKYFKNVSFDTSIMSGNQVNFNVTGDLKKNEL